MFTGNDIPDFYPFLLTLLVLSCIGVGLGVFEVIRVLIWMANHVHFT